MPALDGQGERPLNLRDGLLHQLPKRQLGMLVVQMFDELRDGLCVRLRLEFEPVVHEVLLQSFVVGDDAVVYHTELCTQNKKVKNFWLLK